MTAEVHVAVTIPSVANNEDAAQAGGAVPSLLASHLLNSPGCSSRSSEDGEKVSVAALQKAALQRSLSLGTNAMIARLKQHGVGEVDADQVVALLDELDAQVKQLRDDHAVTRRERRVLMAYGALVALASLVMIAVVLGCGVWFVLRYATQVQNSLLGAASNMENRMQGNTVTMRPTAYRTRKEYDWSYVADRMDLSQVEAIVIWPYSDSEMLLGVSGVMRLPEIDLSNDIDVDIAPQLPGNRDEDATIASRTALATSTTSTTINHLEEVYQPASLVFNTALGVLRLNKNTLTVMNGDVLDALEAAGVPTCRNPRGDRAVASGMPPCDIMIPPKERVGHQYNQHLLRTRTQSAVAGVHASLGTPVHTKVTLLVTSKV